MAEHSSNNDSETDQSLFDQHLARCQDVESGWTDTVFNAIIDGRIPVDKSKFTSYVPNRVLLI